MCTSRAEWLFIKLCMGGVTHVRCEHSIRVVVSQVVLQILFVFPFGDLDLFPQRIPNFLLVCKVMSNDCHLTQFLNLDFFERPGSRWSGWPLRASSSASTLCRVTSGPMVSCYGRFSLWVNMETTLACPIWHHWDHFHSLCSPVQVRVHIPTLQWMPTSTGWSKMDTTWRLQTLHQLKCGSAPFWKCCLSYCLMRLICPWRYHLMTLCWSLEPTHRPTFKQVGKHINRLLLSTCGSSGCHSPEVRTHLNLLWPVHAPTLTLLFLSANIQEHRRPERGRGGPRANTETKSSRRVR